MLDRIRSMSLTSRIIGLTAIIIAAVVSANFYNFSRAIRASSVDSMVEKAAAFTVMADEGVVVALEQDDDQFESRHQWHVARRAAARENLDFGVVATGPENPDNTPVEGTYPAQMLADLQAQVDGGGEWTLSRVDERENQVHYMRGVRLGAPCVDCHDGSAANQTWAEGTMHGAYHVTMPMASIDQAVSGFLGKSLLWAVPLAILCLVAFFFALRGVFSRPMAMVLARLSDIAEGEGDLTQRIPVTAHDEVGQLGLRFNKFVDRMERMIIDVAGVSRDVASAATEVAASSDQMASGLETQSQQVLEISTAIEEVAASAGEVAERSGLASESASNSRASAEEGGVVVAETIQGMHAISDSVRSGADAVVELGKRGEEIGKIIEVINDIADQTNLLALNAAIEAARAGEHGRGFAVVADEVRSLADRTTKATQEIRTSITQIQSETDNAVQRMEESRGQIEKGTESAARAEESLRGIVSSAVHVTEMVQAIAAAAEQQSVTSVRVSQNSDAVRTATGASKEGAVQAALAAAQLAEKAEQLQALVDTFKVRQEVTGPHSAPASTPVRERPAARITRRAA